jgi:hypothetical protein
MSRGIGPVLLTHFTPDEAAEETNPEDTAPATASGTNSFASVGATAPGTKSGVLVAPAPTGRTARHRAGRGRRPLVLAKPAAATSTEPSTDEVVPATTELPLVEQLRNTPKNLRILAMTAGAVVLIAVGFGMIRAPFHMAGIPVPAGPGNTTGMQPGTLPDAALSGIPTTTVVAPPPATTPVQATTAPPTTHHTHTAAPPPATTTTNAPSGSNFDQPGQPCSQPGQFGIDSNYRPVACAADASGNYTWQQF